MNERILELAKLAGIKANSEQAMSPREQLFAELIVKECSGVNYHSSFQDGEFHARELLDHFGIGE